jgi:predicted nucleic acid-binding protein
MSDDTGHVDALRVMVDELRARNEALKAAFYVVGVAKVMLDAAPKSLSPEVITHRAMTLLDAALVAVCDD